MNEPNKEYGWITASTNRELEALGLPKLGDQILGDDKTWKDVHPDWHGKIPYYKQYTVRRPIDPGEGWEIVPEDDVSGVEVKIATAMGWQPTYDGITWGTVKEGERGIAVRRRKTKSEPAMDDGWELVPKEELKFGDNQPTWEYKSPGDAEWTRCSRVATHNTYRRRKSKPVEQWGWLKVGCGVEMPYDDYFNVKLEDGREGMVSRNRVFTKFKWASSHMPIESPIAYWFRTPSAPKMEKVDPCKEALKKFQSEYSDHGTLEEEEAAFVTGWHACCDHYKVGDQSKGAK